MYIITLMIYNRKLNCFLHINSSVVEASKGVLICSNLSDRNKLCKFLISSETLTSAVNIALTGLWSDSFDSLLLYSSCFKPFPYHTIRSHLN